MISLPIEIGREKIDSRYRFVIAVAQRAKQLNQGSIPTKKTKARKITTIALEEVTCGTVYVFSGEEAVIARKVATICPRSNA